MEKFILDEARVQRTVDNYRQERKRCTPYVRYKDSRAGIYQSRS